MQFYFGDFFLGSNPIKQWGGDIGPYFLTRQIHLANNANNGWTAGFPAARAQFIYECVQETNFSLTNANSKHWYNWDKKVDFVLILYSFPPSDMNFQTILMPKGILAKILWQKIYSFVTFLIKQDFYSLLKVWHPEEAFDEKKK